MEGTDVCVVYKQVFPNVVGIFCSPQLLAVQFGYWISLGLLCTNMTPICVCLHTCTFSNLKIPKKTSATDLNAVKLLPAVQCIIGDGYY